MKNSAFLSLAALSPCVAALACASSGDGSMQGATVLRAQPTYQAPFFNPSQPGTTTQWPSTTADQPAPNPNDPVSTTQPPPGSTTPGNPAFSCDSFCSPFVACLQDCQTSCRELLTTASGPCSGETLALLSCAQTAGLHCTDNGKLKAATDACSAEADLWDTCVSQYYRQPITLPDGGQL